MQKIILPRFEIKVNKSQELTENNISVSFRFNFPNISSLEGFFSEDQFIFEPFSVTKKHLIQEV